MSIIKLNPAFKDYLWGGTKLKENFGKRCIFLNIHGNFGENIAFFKEAAVDCPDYIINSLKRKDGTRITVQFRKQ